MASQTAAEDASFEQSLQNFKKSLSIDEQKACEVTTLRDLQASVLNIQKKQVRHALSRTYSYCFAV